MDSSQSLAIESFSYSWLTNVNPSLEGLEVPLRPSIDSSCELTFYNRVKSRRSLEEAQINFNFDVPVSHSADVLAHADQLFSDGLIKPGCVHQANIDQPFNSLPVSPPAVSSSSKAVVPSVNIHSKVVLFGRWRRLSKQILQDFLGYVTPFCLNKSRTSSRKSKRVDDIDRRTWEVKSWSSSPQSSPRQITVHSTSDWIDIERSVYEAILHCKRSIDN